jgi:hypothetical protein
VVEVVEALGDDQLGALRRLLDDRQRDRVDAREVVLERSMMRR